MGAATACSSVCASAPTYVANTWISGGAILGNWATGRLNTVSAPTITIRMETTIATIGRLMKNLDTRLPSLLGSRPISQDQVKRSALEFCLPARFGRESAVEIKVFRLADSEIHLDGIDGGHRGNRCAACAHQRPYLQLGLSNNAVDGRRKPSKAKVESG